MQSTMLLFTLALIVAAYLVALNILGARRARWIWRFVRVERTRTIWAQARDDLFALVRSGKLDIHSETFRTFYGIQTFIMRRPEAYGELSRRLARAYLGAPPGTANDWQNEMSRWPKEMEGVLSRMERGILHLMFGCSGNELIVTHLVHLSQWLAVHMGQRFASLIVKIASLVIPRVEMLRTYVAVKERLHEIGDAVSRSPERLAYN